MITKKDAESTEDSVKNIVLTFLNALNNENFEKARECLSDNMAFDGVLGHRDGAETYINDMKKMKFKYNIKKTFEDGNDVCIFYDIDMSGKKIFTCGWYIVNNKKIKSIKVVFDPRPVLEQTEKK